jgi:hypothetical protein
MGILQKAERRASLGSCLLCRIVPSDARRSVQAANHATVLFADDLTKFGDCDLLWPLQPKSSFLPEAGCGGTSSGA